MSFFDNFFNKCSCEGHQVYPATITPIMDGVGYVGSSDKYAREDHVHPSDTSKQDTLISGANIKTINGESLLGGGDLVVGGSSGYLVTLNYSKTEEAYFWTADKTAQEIIAAQQSGLSPVCVMKTSTIPYEDRTALFFAQKLPYDIYSDIWVNKVVELGYDDYYMATTQLETAIATIIQSVFSFDDGSGWADDNSPYCTFVLEAK